MTKDDLIAFEADIAAEFNNAKIRAPVHLAGGNEADLIRIFKDHNPEHDWVFSNWRSHYHALLHGVPPEKIKAAIMAGHSISLCFPDYRFYSSAIVSGHLPIALGVAWAIKRAAAQIKYMGDRPYRQTDDPDGHASISDEASRKLAAMAKGRVWVFLGDMAMRTGICHECENYASGNGLPITFVAENNGRSVCTETVRAWATAPHERQPNGYAWSGYRYTLPWPHSGAGQRVEF